MQDIKHRPVSLSIGAFFQHARNIQHTFSLLLYDRCHFIILKNVHFVLAMFQIPTRNKITETK